MTKNSNNHSGQESPAFLSRMLAIAFSWSNNASNYRY
jgi:hypothetical protein